MYFIYRYVDQRDDQIIYVGKTKRNLRDRIIEHENEMKFFFALFKHSEDSILYARQSCGDGYS